MSLGRRIVAESIGTFWLVFAGCGTAVLAAGVPDVGIGWVGVSIAFGLSLTLIHLVGIPVTNTSVNPARSTGPALFVGGWALSSSGSSGSRRSRARRWPD